MKYFQHAIGLDSGCHGGTSPQLGIERVSQPVADQIHGQDQSG
jgi:hypothetical protein